MTSYEDNGNHQYLSDNKIDSQPVNHYNSPPYYSQQQSASPPMSITYGNHHTVASPPLTPAVSPVTPILSDSVSGNHPGNSMDHHQPYTGFRHNDKSDISYISGNKYDPFPSYVYYGNSMFSNFGNNNISGSSSSSTSSSITSSAIHSPLTASQSLQQQHKHVCQFNHCGWSFKRYEHLKRHMLVHTGERPHTCHFPGCGKSFSRSDNFHAHYRTHAKKKISRKGSTKSSVTDDRTCHSGNSFSSLANQSPSQKKLINTSSIASTVAANAAAAVAVSQQLGQNNGVYYNTNLYQSPEMTVYSRNTSAFHNSPTSSMMDFACSARGQSASSSAASPSTPFLSLLNHESSSSASESSSSPFYTSPSYASFPSYQPYSKKINKGHSNNTSNPKSHTCPVSQCMRRFKRLEHLKRHMRIHTLERPFACTYPGCQKNFSRSDNLSQHVKTHQKHEDKRRRKQQQQQQQ